MAGGRLPWLLLIGAAALVVLSADAPAAPGNSSRAERIRLEAERAIYNLVDAKLYVVGGTVTSRDGALTWSAPSAGESGSVLCAHETAASFSCEWTAQLIQHYRGVAKVRFDHHEPSVQFTHTTCANPRAAGGDLPNLCALNPAPGMAAAG